MNTVERFFNLFRRLHPQQFDDVDEQIKRSLNDLCPPAIVCRHSSLIKFIVRSLTLNTQQKNETHPELKQMKQLLSLFLILVATATLSFAQRVDYSTYQLVAQKGKVYVVVKDNNWRMVTCSLKRPKLDFLLDVSKAQALGNIDRLMQKCTNEKHTKADREVRFCGVPLFATIVHSGEESEQLLFVAKYVTAKFSLTKTDCLENRQAIERYIQP